MVRKPNGIRHGISQSVERQLRRPIRFDPPSDRPALRADGLGDGATPAPRDGNALLPALRKAPTVRPWPRVPALRRADAAPAVAVTGRSRGLPFSRLAC